MPSAAGSPLGHQLRARPEFLTTMVLSVLSTTSVRVVVQDSPPLEHALDRKLQFRRSPAVIPWLPWLLSIALYLTRPLDCLAGPGSRARIGGPGSRRAEMGCRQKEAERRIRTEGREAGGTISEYGPRRGGERRPRDQGGYAPDDDTGGTGPPAAAEARRGRRGDAYPGARRRSQRKTPAAPNESPARSLVNQVSNHARLRAATQKRAGSQQHSRRRSERTIYVLSRDARSAAETAALERFMSRKMRRLTRWTPTDSFST